MFIIFRTKDEQVGRAIKNCVPVEHFPDHWTENLKPLPSNIAGRLTALEAEVAYLLWRADSMFQCPHDVTETHLDALLDLALKIDSKFNNWATELPHRWFPQPAEDSSPATLSKFQAYGQRIDVYSEVWIMSTWNPYRVIHLTVKRVIIFCCLFAIVNRRDCGDWQALHKEHTTLSHQLVDDICASIPFCLGTRTSYEPDDEVEYPTTLGSSIRGNHRQTAAALGGWFSLGSLGACLNVLGLESSQVDWISTQIRRIKSFYGFEDHLPADPVGKHFALYLFQSQSNGYYRHPKPTH